MDPLRALIVDDEPLARERLSRLLREAGWTVMGELGDGQALIEWMKGPRNVDALFLDVQMPGLNGMEALADVPNPPPVVFVTAYSEYAVRAFELAAQDYLLKPVFEERLARCLQRLRDHLIRPLTPAEIRALLPPPARFPIRVQNGEIFLELAKVTHFELKEDVVWACHGQDRFRTRWGALSEVESAFPEEPLIRIQRNLLLRPAAVRGHRLNGLGRMAVLVAQGVELPVSRAMARVLRTHLRELVSS